MAAKWKFEDTVSPFPNLIIHKGVVKSGVLRVSDVVDLRVEAKSARRATMANHSATHLLQWALRKSLATT